MASKTPSHPARRRRSPKTRNRTTSRGKNTSARRQRTKKSQRRRAGTPRAQSAQSALSKGGSTNARFSLPKPPPPEDVVKAVREELERLSARWKNLLPRLKQSGGNGAKRTSGGAAPKRKRARG